MKLRDLRAYVPGRDDTTGVNPASYETGTDKSILRKINLNVDLATQAELNEAFGMLSAAISSTQGDLDNYYTKSEVNAISTALSDTAAADIAAEASARQEADEAITASLSAYALSTTVADAYKVTVANPTEIEGDKLRYEVLQGGEHAGYLDIAKDQFVSAAAFDGTVLTLTLRDGTKISTDLGDLADYSGVDGENATVDINDNHEISVYVKDYASKTYVDGVSADVSAAAAADIAAAEAAAKAYTDEVSTAISSAFEPRVADNESVAAVVKDLSATWSGGGTAIQSVEGDDVYLTATTNEDHEVTVAATADLCAAVANANSALQTVSQGTDGTYVTTTVGTKENNDQTVAVALTFGELSAGTSGVAKAEEAKAYVDAAVAGKNVDAEGDDLVKASAANNKVTVNASDALCAVVAKVEAASSDWDDAVAVAGVVKSTSATWDTVADKADLTALEAETTARENADTFLSGKIDALSVSLNAAEGDAYVSAYVDGNTVKVETQDRTKTAIDRVEGSAAAWDEVSAKADLTAVDGLSAIYKTIAKVNNAVSSTRFDLPITDDYEDIDDIIADIIEIRKALNMLRETAGGGGGDELPTGYDFYGIAELPAAGASERALYGVTADAGQYTVTLLKSKATDATFADTDAAFEPSDPTNGIIAVTHNGYSTGYSLADDGEGGYDLSRWSGESENQSHATFTEVTVAAAETFYNS